MEKQHLTRLTELCGKAVDQGVCSGVTACVCFRQEKRWKQVFAASGRTSGEDSGSPVRPETLFDLASLTKPLCTTLGVLALASEGRLDLNAPVTALSCCRDWPEHWQQICLKDLLHHCSGLPAYREYFRDFLPVQQADNRSRLFRQVLGEKPEYARLSRCVYSDLGFLALGEIVEKVSGLPLAVFFRERLAEPLGLADRIGFRPLDRRTVPLTGASAGIAATENCPWRGRVLQGEVHDEHAWLLGGVAGHAGLFGDVGAVAGFCCLLVDCWQGRQDHPKIRGELLRQALAYRSPAGLWALGFDRPTPQTSSSGDCFSPESVGHLGFTGTSFWIDLAQEKIVILLTNRVHPSRENQQIRQFRPWFHNCVMREMLGCP